MPAREHDLTDHVKNGDNALTLPSRTTIPAKYMDGYRSIWVTCIKKGDLHQHKN